MISGENVVDCLKSGFNLSFPPHGDIFLDWRFSTNFIVPVPAQSRRRQLNIFGSNEGSHCLEFK